jgi:hypothetical protein
LVSVTIPVIVLGIILTVALALGTLDEEPPPPQAVKNKAVAPIANIVVIFLISYPLIFKIR